MGHPRDEDGRGHHNVTGRGYPNYAYEWGGHGPPSEVESHFRKLLNGKQLGEHEVYRFELNRLNSFCTWPKSALAYPTHLARSGLYYTGTSDTVRCFACNVQIGQWVKEDLPLTEHQKHSSKCPFLLEADVGNVPLQPGNARFSLKALKENEENILKGRLEQASNTTQGTVRDTEVTQKIDQLKQTYVCSNLDFTKLCGINSQRSGFVANNQPQLPMALASDSSPTGAMSLACDLANLDVSAAPSSGQQSLPPQQHVVEAVPACGKQDTVRDDTSPETFDSVRNNTSKNDDVEYDAATFQTPPETPSNDMLRSRLRNSPPRYGLTEFCDIMMLLTMVDRSQHPEYVHINDRLDSFQNWEYGNVQDPIELAKAGFYYTGREDRVRCFMCNGGLCNWETTDNPWYEHKRWFGRCQYVIQCLKHPVVKAIIETASQLAGSNAEEEVQQYYGHHHHGNGQVQCDCRKGSTPQNIWETQAVRRVLDMGFTRLQIQEAVNRDGRSLVLSTEELLDAVTSQPASAPSPPVYRTALDNVQQRPEVVESDTNDQVAVEAPSVKKETVKTVSKKRPEIDARMLAESDVHEIMKENEALKSDRVCKICLDTMVQVIFLPCSHLVCCVDCSLQLDKCPLCRQHIKATARVFL